MFGDLYFCQKTTLDYDFVVFDNLSKYQRNKMPIGYIITEPLVKLQQLSGLQI